jgi:hypothetical protein
MAIPAVLFSRQRLSLAAGGASSSHVECLPAERVRLSEFVTLMKPRVMSLAVFTALVGLMIAPGHLDPLLGSIAILAIAAGAGAAGVLNMWYDADIDGVMTRTAMRPIPCGAVSRVEALVFGLVLAGGAVAVLALAANAVAAALLAFTIFFYVVVYTIWLKRLTPQNIVIGGAAGALLKGRIWFPRAQLRLPPSRPKLPQPKRTARLSNSVSPDEARYAVPCTGRSLPAAEPDTGGIAARRRTDRSLYLR